ncbi:MAG: septum formation initiator family protein [Candidatus Gastranaerophilaceae bacterium]
MDNDNIYNKYSKNTSKHTRKPRITNIEEARKRAKKKNGKIKSKSNVYYSFLTIVLLICLVQLTYSALLNITKTVSYHNKIIQIRKIRDDAEKKNKKLKQEIKEFSTTASLEAIARNNLKMAGEDEVLILINDNDEEQAVNKNKKKKKGIFGNDR